MSEPIVCVGEGSRPTGIRYAVGGPRAISPGEYPSLSLTNTPPEKYFPQMAARGVHLTWEKEGFVLYWRPNAAFPYVDIYAWCDVEYIQIHLSALMRRFKLRMESKGILLSTPLLHAPLVFCDIETTGFDHAKERICEISICRMEPNQEPVWFTSLIHPGRKIKNSEVHKITDKMVIDEPRFDRIATKVREMVSDCVFISHQNNQFDERFITNELDRCDIRWQPSAKLSTMSLARSLLNTKSFNLPDLAKALSLPAPQSHRAKSDVETMMALWEVLYLKAKECDPIPETLGDFAKL